MLIIYFTINNVEIFPDIFRISELKIKNKRIFENQTSKIVFNISITNAQYNGYDIISSVKNQNYFKFKVLLT